MVTSVGDPAANTARHSVFILSSGGIEQMDRQFVVACLLVAVLAASGATAATTQPSSVGLLAQPDGFDQTTFEITVTANGSARWAIKHHQRLANASERQAFEDFAQAFEHNETQLYQNFVSGANALVSTGRNTTERPMEANGFGRAAYTNVTANFEDRGTVELQFTWTHFGRTDGDRVVVGDVFGENFYIGQNQAIVFVRGSGLQFDAALPAPTSQTDPESLADSHSVTWEGEATFNQERPYAVLIPRQPTTTTGATGDSGPAASSDTPTTGNAPTAGGTATDDGAGAGTEPPANETTEPLGSGTSNPMVWLVGVVIVVLGVSSAIAYRTGSITLPGRSEATAVESTEQPSTSAESTPQTQTPIPDEELLSDSDRVVKLLEDNGGRMKQVNIVDETEWSKSKVSMLLSDMEDDGDISKLRVGRENIISLAGHEPDAAGSPFEDDE